MTTKVFVYGTLLSGYGNNRLLRNAKLIGEAKTEPVFTMYHMGGFPGVAMEGDTTIVGEVYEVDEDTEYNLDCLEGADRDNPENGLYRRELITLQDGQKALIYVINDHNRYGDENVVTSGSWRIATGEECTYYRHG